MHAACARCWQRGGSAQHITVTLQPPPGNCAALSSNTLADFFTPAWHLRLLWLQTASARLFWHRSRALGRLTVHLQRRAVPPAALDWRAASAAARAHPPPPPPPRSADAGLQRDYAGEQQGLAAAPGISLAYLRPCYMLRPCVSAPTRSRPFWCCSWPPPLAWQRLRRRRKGCPALRGFPRARGARGRAAEGGRASGCPRHQRHHAAAACRCSRARTHRGSPAGPRCCAQPPRCGRLDRPPPRICTEAACCGQDTAAARLQPRAPGAEQQPHPAGAGSCRW